MDGAAVEVSPTEFRLLAVLVRRPGRLVTKPELLRLVWGGVGSPNAVESAVSSLRRKLGTGGAIVQTVRGRGYLATVPAQGPPGRGVGDIAPR